MNCIATIYNMLVRYCSAFRDLTTVCLANYTLLYLIQTALYKHYIQFTYMYNLYTDLTVGYISHHAILYLYRIYISVIYDPLIVIKAFYETSFWVAKQVVQSLYD